MEIYKFNKYFPDEAACHRKFREYGGDRGWHASTTEGRM